MYWIFFEYDTAGTGQKSDQFIVLQAEKNQTQSYICSSDKKKNSSASKAYRQFEHLETNWSKHQGKAL